MNLITLTYSDKKINLLYKKKEGSFYSAQVELPNGVVENSIIKNIGEFAKILKIAVEKKLNLNSQVVLRCAIPEEKSYIQILQIPQVPLDKINQVIRWQSKILLTFDVENVYLDTQVIEEKDNKLKILATASPKILIDSLIAAIKQASYQINAIDTHSGALARLFATKPHELIAIADIEDKVATLVIAKNSIARLSITVELTDQDRPFIKKVKELIEFYTTRKETNKEITKLYLIGDVPKNEIDQWKKSLKLQLIPASIEKISKPSIKGIPDSFIANFGLFGDIQQGVNLLPTYEAQDIEQNNIILQLKYSLKFLCGLLVALVIITILVYINESIKLNQIVNNNVYSSDKMDTFGAEKLTELNSITSQVNALPKIKSKDIYLSSILNLQSDGILVTEINIDNEAGSIKGSVKDRESLISFINHINTQKIFSNILVPLSNYENNDNIPMEIKFKIK